VLRFVRNTPQYKYYTLSLYRRDYLLGQSLFESRATSGHPNEVILERVPK
jgi:hypothetical protein